jgi:hypothetical protein
MTTNDIEEKYRTLLALMDRQERQARERREKKLAKRQPKRLPVVLKKAA